MLNPKLSLPSLRFIEPASDGIDDVLPVRAEYIGCLYIVYRSSAGHLVLIVIYHKKSNENTISASAACELCTI